MQTELLAAADQFEKVQLAEAARDVFLARWRARTELSPAEEWALEIAFDALASAIGRELAHEEYMRRRQERIAVHAFLTDFRLSLEALTAILGKRDKVIVDTDKLPGRRHLFLFAPETFRPPPPVILQDRMLPDRKPKGEGH